MISPIQRQLFHPNVYVCVIFSILFHLCLLFVLAVFLISPFRRNEDKPSLFIPSYTYQAPSAPPAEQQPVDQKPREVSEELKPGMIEEASYQASQSFSNPNKVNVLNISKKKTEEPVHLVGDKGIAKPLIVLIGKALTAKLIYPKGAVDFNVRGVSIVGFLLHPDGTVTDTRLMQSSGAGVLDDEALNAVNAISPVKNTQQFLNEAKFIVIGIIFG